MLLAYVEFADKTESKAASGIDPSVTPVETHAHFEVSTMMSRLVSTPVGVGHCRRVRVRRSPDERVGTSRAHALSSCPEVLCTQTE